MGSLKDEMRGLREDHQPCEKTDDAERPVDSDGCAGADGTPLHTSQESTTQDNYQPELCMNASSAEEGDETPASKDQLLSGADCDNTDKLDSKLVKGCTQTEVMIVTPQPAAQEGTSTQKEATISGNLSNNEDPEGKNMVLDRGKETNVENILVPVPLTPGPSSPHSPAPFGQHHIRTQVSLEVVQCCSAATSPMTPPEDGHSFFFPSTFGRSGAVGTDTKDAELQVGQQVKFCSVATSPMTPKTPSTTAFPELVGKETIQKEEKVKKSECNQQESFTTTESPAEAAPDKTTGLKFATSKEPSESLSMNASPGSSTSCLSARLIDSQVALEDSNQHCKQQRMGSMDQDITILVTEYGSNEEEEEEAASYFHSTATDIERLDERDEGGEDKNGVKSEDGQEKTSAEILHDIQDTTSTNHELKHPQEPKVSMKEENSTITENKNTCEEMTKPHVPESPAPFGCHNIRTQVSLEVVQCQSVATSPMTPPEGDHTFFFPSSFGKCGSVGTDTKDAELQVGTQVEFRSVATAPMTPRTPTSATFAEIKTNTGIEEKIIMEEENKKEETEEDKKEAYKEEDQVTTEKKIEEDRKDVINCKEQSEDKSEEPVQEVSWDEKGMTWEVYGAVVEVAVLGSAIQKHLEKQVKKQKRQSSMPPPPPLTPSAIPLTSEVVQGHSGKGRAGKRGGQDGKVGRRRRNPFRLLMENMQQPNCCSRAQSTE